jgi:crotonobetainyl-CoA:carnitine CoA-transferase CaiB-like acyl-CoA transferase
VVDLSTLWAGPLASHLMQLGGARVVKVESTSRPDGARRGPARFFDLLHAGKESVALDFTSPTGRRALVSLVARADIVLESARPRAMHQLGIDPAALVRARPGLTWISITGYGRRGHAATSATTPRPRRGSRARPVTSRPSTRRSSAPTQSPTR